MTQKIIKIGNSTGIIIPKLLLDSLGLKSGSEVKIESDPTTKTLIIQHANTVKNSSISPYFLKILDKVNDQYGSALRQLAQK